MTYYQHPNGLFSQQVHFQMPAFRASVSAGIGHSGINLFGEIANFPELSRCLNFENKQAEKPHSQSFSASMISSFDPRNPPNHEDEFLFIPARTEPLTENQEVSEEKYLPKRPLFNKCGENNVFIIEQKGSIIKEESSETAETNRTVFDRERFPLNHSKSPFNRYKTETYGYKPKAIPRISVAQNNSAKNLPVSHRKGSEDLKLLKLNLDESKNDSLHNNYERHKLIGPQKQLNDGKSLFSSHKLILFSPCKMSPTKISSENKDINKSIKPTFVPSKKSINRFEIIKKVGCSEYSEAFLCYEKKSFGIYCLKKIKKSLVNSKEMLNRFIHKLGLQFRSSHPNIIQIYDVFCDNEFVYLIEEFMESGSLKNYLELPKSQKSSKYEEEVKKESNVIEKLYHLSSALKYIHTSGNGEEKIIHGDLRPDTILMNFGICKICPVNPTKIDKSTSFVHSYIAPEVLAEQTLSEKSDMWNLGLLLYELVCHRCLFKAQKSETDESLTDQIVNMDYNKEIANITSATNSLKEIIKNLLKVRPDDRLSSAETLNANLIKIYGVRVKEEEKKRDKIDGFVKNTNIFYFEPYRRPSAYLHSNNN